MKSKAKLLVVLVAIVSLGFAACAVSQPASSTTAKNFTGVWRRSSGTEAYLQLNEDGTYSFAWAQQELEEAPIEIGEFRLEGTSLTFIASDESASCAGQTGSYQVELTEQGQLEFVIQEDPCWDRRHGVPTQSWDRVEP
jgi:hypothetical protein